MHNTYKNEISEDFGSLQEKICGSEENFYYLHDRATHFLEEIPKLREIQRTHVPCPFCDLLFLGMVSHKMSLITILGHKHKIKNFIKKFDIFHEKISMAFEFWSIFGIKFLILNLK